jgi:hypothetical protein
MIGTFLVAAIGYGGSLLMMAISLSCFVRAGRGDDENDKPHLSLITFVGFFLIAFGVAVATRWLLGGAL